MSKVRFIVSSNDEPISLQKYLQKVTESRFSLREIKHALEQKRCFVNSEVERFGSKKLYAGDTVDLIEFTKDDLKPVRFSFDSDRVLFEDETLLVYNKPSGLSSIDNGLFEILKKERSSLFPIHRLDKDTSGVIIFAKTEQEALRLIHAFREREVLKQYLAIVQGSLSKKTGTITSYLGKTGEFQGQTIMGAVDKKKGQIAITEWRVLKENKEFSLVSLEPKTGRTHQLRSHMSSLGHPLIGDVQYGWKASSDYYPKSFFLHASRLQFKNDPTRNFVAELPSAFAGAVEFLFGKGKI